MSDFNLCPSWSLGPGHQCQQQCPQSQSTRPYCKLNNLVQNADSESRPSNVLQSENDDTEQTPFDTFLGQSGTNDSQESGLAAVVSAERTAVQPL